VTPAVRAVDLAGRVPPHNGDAEAAVLSAVLTERAAIDDVVPILPDGAAFYTDAHRRIYDTAVELYQAGQPVDIQTVAESLRSRNRLQPIGGLTYLSRLVSATPAVAHIKAHARIVRDLGRVRSMIEACQIAAAEGYTDHGAPQDFLNATAARVTEIAVSQSDRAEPTLMFDAMQAMVQAYDSPQAAGVSTGIRSLDAIIGGLRPSDLIIVGGRSGMGKSGLALNLAANVPAQSDHATTYGSMFFSLEMPRDQCAARMACAHGRVSVSSVMRRTMVGTETDRFFAACSELGQRPIWIDDTPAITPAEVEAKVRAQQRKFDAWAEDERGRKAYTRRIGVVVIDYLQLMQPTGEHQSREQEVASITRTMKAMAKRLDVPIVLLSQLSRAVETRGKDKRPMLSDLRESGAIEQDADIVLFPFRPEYYVQDKESPEAKALAGKAEIIVAKQRNGPLGDARATYHDKYTLFTDEETTPWQ
jgi:replicative DNA helicase